MELLPHAGVVIVGARQGPGPSGANDHWTDGYAVAGGKRLWSVPGGGNGDEPEYTVDRDTVYVWLDAANEDGHEDIAAYDVRTGKRRWITDPGANSDPLGAEPLLSVFGGHVYVMAGADSDNGTTNPWQLLALRTTDGKRAWRFRTPATEDVSEDGGEGEYTVTPVGAGQVLVSYQVSKGTGNTDSYSTSYLYLLNTSTGAVVSSMPGPSSDPDQIQVCDPAGHTAIAVAGAGRIRVLSADAGISRTIKIPAGNSNVQITDRVAYVRKIRKDAPVAGYDLATGRLAWKAPAPHTPNDADLIAFNGGFAVSKSGTSSRKQVFELFH